MIAKGQQYHWAQKLVFFLNQHKVSRIPRTSAVNERLWLSSCQWKAVTLQLPTKGCDSPRRQTVVKMSSDVGVWPLGKETKRPGVNNTDSASQVSSRSGLVYCRNWTCLYPPLPVSHWSLASRGELSFLHWLHWTCASVSAASAHGGRFQVVSNGKVS